MRIEEQVANIIENRGYNEIDPYTAYLVECDVLKNHLRDPEYLESYTGYELNQLVIDTWELFHVERKPQHGRLFACNQKKTWFVTLREALECENLDAANQWPLDVNVPYGSQINVSTDDFEISIYRSEGGYYQRPTIIKRDFMKAYA